VSSEALSQLVVFAHKGKMGPEGAVTFAWLLLALAGLLLPAVLIGRIRSGQRPSSGDLVVAVPFTLLACCCFAFAAACQQGADPRTAWWLVLVAFPISLCLLGKRSRR
jgi:hypothetical protein